MKIKGKILGAFFGMIFLICSNAPAYAIKEGAVSFTGASSGLLAFTNNNTNGSNNSNSLINLTAGSGYFIRDNVELGIGLSVEDSRYRGFINSDETSYTISPNITFHCQINESSNIFYGVGIGYSQYRAHFPSTAYTPAQTSTSAGTVAAAKIGWEYFLNNWTALQVALNISHSNNKATSPYIEISNKQDSVASAFGFSIYFK